MSLNPLPLLSSAAGAAGSFLGGIQTYLIVGAVSAAVAFAGGAYSGYRWELGTYKALVAADAVAQAKAVQAQADSDRRQAAVTLVAAVAEAHAQDFILRVTLNTKLEIPTYVTPIQDARACISVGLERVMYAAAAGVAPSTLILATGQSDDDCSDVTASEMAGWFTPYAGASIGNAEQLNSLIAETLNNHKAQVTP